MNTIPFGRLTNGWFIPPPTIGDSKTAYEIRAIIARVGLTANTPKEAIYFDATLDGDSEPLTGTKKYTMTFKQDPPYIKPSFWALRMFDATNSYAESNQPLCPPKRLPDMKRNPDGHVDHLPASRQPGADKEANWLPAPRGPFLLILGTYAPGEALIKSLSDPTAYIPPAAVAVG